MTMKKRLWRGHEYNCHLQRKKKGYGKKRTTKYFNLKNLIFKQEFDLTKTKTHKISNRIKKSS